MPKLPKITAKHPRIVINVAALTNMVYTGIGVVQDLAAHRFTQDDKVFVASFIVGLVSLIATFGGVEVAGEQNNGPVTVNVEPGQSVKLQ